jgi:hypothetical protein
MWDFTASGKSTVLAAKAGDITAPTASATNVDWLMLNSVQGSLATQVFRIDTVNGQPPTSVSSLPIHRFNLGSHKILVCCWLC